jgi:hypothetical protein
MVEQQLVEGRVIGNAGHSQQGGSCLGQLRHRPAPIVLARNTSDQAAPFQALDGPGEPAGAEPDSASQPGHALGASRVSQRTQQLEFPERQPVHRTQPRIEPAADHEVGLAQAAPDCFTITSSPFFPVRLRVSSRIHSCN